MSISPSRIVLALTLLVALATSARANLIITEVMSSSGAGGTPDWFELTNTGPAAVPLTGYKMDDGSFSFANSVALNGVASLAVGQTAVFFESTATPATEINAFRTFWGGSNSGLPGVQVGYYLGSGAGVSLSSGGDGAVVYNGSGTVVAGPVSFGAATTGTSFGYNTTTQTFGGLSVVGQFGAFNSSSVAPLNIGSPGTIGAVPEPSTMVLSGFGLLALAACARRRRVNRSL